MKKIFFSLCLFHLICLAIPKKINPFPPNSFSSSRTDTIQIVCLNFKEKELLPQISEKIQSYYHHPTIIKESQVTRSLISPIRNRYDADKIIAFLKSQNKGKYKFVAGLTSHDICTPKNNVPDWGVFGLGSLDGSGCISSTYRMKKGVLKSQLLERLEKVILHEIGHNYGLNHCTSPYPCFMKDANGTIKQVDSEPMDMCVECKKRIKN